MRLGSLRDMLAVALLGITACGTPQWRVDVAAPAGTQLLRDGRATSAAALEGPIPYYGTAELTAVPPPAPDDAPVGSSPLPWRTDRVLVTIEEPVSPWLFPLDFLVELASWPFGPADDVVATGVLRPAPRAAPAPPAAGAAPLEDDAEIAALRARARRAVTARGPLPPAAEVR
ncbi:MAG: hypothetical protein IPM29_21705 [Planctomycetes bacterium]|nr:hypothetical protein [Planctomycetota bacterium]